MALRCSARGYCEDIEELGCAPVCSPHGQFKKLTKPSGFCRKCIAAAAQLVLKSGRTLCKQMRRLAASTHSSVPIALPHWLLCWQALRACIMLIRLITTDLEFRRSCQSCCPIRLRNHGRGLGQVSLCCTIQPLALPNTLWLPISSTGHLLCLWLLVRSHHAMGEAFVSLKPLGGLDGEFSLRPSTSVFSKLRKGAGAGLGGGLSKTPVRAKGGAASMRCPACCLPPADLPWI